MGIYINPTTAQTKLQWLLEHGSQCKVVPTNFAMLKRKGKIPVCLVDNVIFDVAGVVYCQEELEAFAAPDVRSKKWFEVPIAELPKASGLSAGELQLLGCSI